jgi:polysaccharide biosynthesis transport protein
LSNLQRFPTLVKTSSDTAAAPPDLMLVDVWASLRRRRRIVLYTLGVFFVLAVLACLFMKPRYEASETVQIEKEGSGPLGLDLQSGQGIAPLDSLDYNTTLQTQADVLTSDALALRTIEDLNLEKTYNFRPTFNPLNWVLSFISPSGTPDPKGVALRDAPQRRARAIRIFSKHLKVKPLDGTRLIMVSYTDPDPKLSAAVVTHLVEGFKEYNFQIRFAATSQASGWLSNELAAVKKSAEDSQARVAQLQQDAQVFTTGDNDPTGKVMATSVVLTRLQDLNTALSTAESNRILKQAVYLSIKNAGAEAVSGLAGNMTSGASPEVMNSLALLQGLRTQQDTLKATYAQNQVKFGPNYPQMQQMHSQIDDLQRSIDEEVAKLESRAKNDYQVARETETNTREMYDRTKGEASKLNSKAIDYTVAKQEATQSQGIYDTLYGRVRESGALAGLRSSNISVVDPSSIPGKPKLPNAPLFLGLAIVGGLFVGSGLALVVDRFDQRVQSIDQIERELGIAPLVILPSMNAGAKDAGSLAASKKRPMLALTGAQTSPLAHSRTLPGPSFTAGERMLPDSAYTEALRVLRTAILHSVDVVPPQVVLVTGSQGGDGSSSVSLNLAVLLAEQGHKVLLVECNMRRPTLQQYLGVSESGGLSALLANTKTEDQATPIPNVPGGFVVTGGGTPPNPSELLGSEAMRSLVAQWRERYDFIILDTPPVLAVADSLTLLSSADLVLLLVRYEHTALKAALQAYRVLASAARHKLFGVVVNDVSPDSGALSDYYGFQQTLYTSELQEVAK